MSPFLACFIFRTILLGTWEMIESLVSDLIFCFGRSGLFCPSLEVQKNNISNKVYMCAVIAFVYIS
jgi:hypothetical protein